MTGEKGVKPKNFKYFQTFNRNRFGTKQSEDWKRKMSVLMKARGQKPPSPLGRKLSQETKNKISQKAKERFAKGKGNLKPKFGKGNPNWKGGKIIKSGYIRVRAENKYVREHRLAMEKKLGRKLLPKEVVHHIDGNRLNNHPDNLKLYPNNKKHCRVEHMKGGENY